MCDEGMSLTPGSGCTVPSFGEAVCEDDGLIGLTWPPVTGGSTVTIPCCSSGEKCKRLN